MFDKRRLKTAFLNMRAGSAKFAHVDVEVNVRIRESVPSGVRC